MIRLPHWPSIRATLALSIVDHLPDYVICAGVDLLRAEIRDGHAREDALEDALERALANARRWEMAFANLHDAGQGETKVSK